jgi:heat shock protein HslJ
MIAFKIFIIPIIILGSLQSSQGQDQTGSPLHDIWMLEVISGEDVMATPDGLPRLEIYVKDLRFIGFGGCNNISGKIELIEGQDLVFGPVLSTRQHCEGRSDTEDKFLEALSATRKWGIENLRLRLYDDAGILLLEFGKTD